MVVGWNAGWLTDRVIHLLILLVNALVGVLVRWLVYFVPILFYLFCIMSGYNLGKGTKVAFLLVSLNFTCTVASKVY